MVDLLLIPYLLDAVRALEHGVASIPDIDRGMQLGCGHPVGPLTLLDFVGLDTTARIADIMFEEYREARYTHLRSFGGWWGRECRSEKRQGLL